MSTLFLNQNIVKITFELNYINNLVLIKDKN